MKKTLSDGYVIENGWRFDLLDDGDFMLETKKFDFFEPNIIEIKGIWTRYSEKGIHKKRTKMIVFTENNHSYKESADEIFSDGWANWEEK